VFNSLLYAACYSFVFSLFVAGVIRMKRSLMSREILEFIANHPFIFFIHKKEADLTLFVGRFVKPRVAVVHHEEL
jgi:serine protease inhibitor